MRHFALSVILALSTATPASAVTLHNAVTTARCGVVQDVNTEVSSPTSVNSRSAAGGINCGASANSQSGGGTTRVFASISNPGLDDDLRLTLGRAQASAYISYNFTIKTRVTQPSVVPFSVNLHSSGLVAASSNKLISENGAFLNSGQVISASLRAFGALGVNGIAQTFEDRASVRVSPGDNQSDNLPGDFTTPTIMVRAGDRISLGFGLDGSTGGQLFGAKADGTVQASNSLSFAIQGNVFNLPDGYEVEIDEARIVNNRYTPPPTLVSPVPLPAAGFAMLFALGGLAALRRK